ncbi:metallophosphoesterase family protein [Geochorda subterranea]|uniref:Metallophosphoesterase n=1 Tax=Geochorda subterranea TaxID=3109564 RepID=A0ABZ1BQB4_9FIRM|nr:metallophosphoesterase [Limnochorda sp. LNt]WRP14302.1 metallophosphoesterase [Limnochorda sp. LNt]
MAATLRLALVTDIHHGPDKPTRPGSVAPGLLRRFVEVVNDEVRPDLVVDLGDRIDNVDPAQDARRDSEVRAILGELRAPVVHLRGNHDHPRHTDGGAPAPLSPPAPHHAGPRRIPSGQWTLLALDTCDPALGGVGGSVSPQQAETFERWLQEGEGPVVVLAHHPLDDHAIDGNPLFAPFPEWAFTREREALRAAMERSGRVVAVFNGHVHWGVVRVTGGIPYVAVPSFLERWRPEGPVPGAYAVATLGPGRRVRVDFRTLEGGMTLRLEHG